ncbi:MAG: hypothetical protein ACLT98_01095 [Eggerthellaceae bacterium]
MPCTTAGVEVDVAENFTDPASLNSSPTRLDLMQNAVALGHGKIAAFACLRGLGGNDAARHGPLTVTEDSSMPAFASMSATLPKSSPTIRSSPDAAAPAQ